MGFSSPQSARKQRNSLPPEWTWSLFSIFLTTMAATPSARTNSKPSPLPATLTATGRGRRLNSRLRGVKSPPHSELAQKNTPNTSNWWTELTEALKTERSSKLKISLFSADSTKTARAELISTSSPTPSPGSSTNLHSQLLRCEVIPLNRPSKLLYVPFFSFFSLFCKVSIRFIFDVTSTLRYFL